MLFRSNANAKPASGQGEAQSPRGVRCLLEGLGQIGPRKASGAKPQNKGLVLERFPSHDGHDELGVGGGVLRRAADLAEAIGSRQTRTDAHDPLATVLSL